MDQADLKHAETVLAEAASAAAEAEAVIAQAKRLEDKIECPHCRQSCSWLVKSRRSDDRTFIARRRECGVCRRRFTTEERVVA